MYYADKDEVTGGNISALGGYSYTEYRLNEYWQFGTRFDYTQPFQQKNTDLSIYQIVPYITWWQSHWVRMRLQYNFIDGKNIDVSSALGMYSKLPYAKKIRVNIIRKGVRRQLVYNIK